ncbi:MAG: hypothetical protein ACK4F7_11060, partial [Inhella sp.]
AKPLAADAPLPAGFAAQRFVGSYLHSDGHGSLRLAVDPKGGLRMHIGTGNSLLRPAAADALQNATGTLRLQLQAGDGELVLSRRADPGRVERFVRLPEFKAEARDLASLAGSYRHKALGADLRLQLRDGALVAIAGADPEPRPLQLLGADLLAGPGLVLRIERDRQGLLQSLVYSSERVRGLRYERD